MLRSIPRRRADPALPPLRRAAAASPSFRLRAHLEDREECFLWDLHLSDAFHPLLSFLLLFEEFPLSGDVAAVAFREDVLAHRLHRFARDDSAADRRLNRDLEHLAWNQFT